MAHASPSPPPAQCPICFEDDVTDYWTFACSHKCCRFCTKVMTGALTSKQPELGSSLAMMFYFAKNDYGSECASHLLAS